MKTITTTVILPVAAILLFLVAYSLGSITLTSNATLNQNGSTLETDSTAALSALQVSFGANAAAPSFVTFTFSYGNGGNTFAPGAQVPSVTVSVNSITGVWTASNGATGTLSGAALTSVQTSLRNIRNSSETFAINAGIVNGTEVTW